MLKEMSVEHIQKYDVYCDRCGAKMELSVPNPIAYPYEYIAGFIKTGWVATEFCCHYCPACQMYTTESSGG